MGMKDLKNRKGITLTLSKDSICYLSQQLSVSRALDKALSIMKNEVKKGSFESTARQRDKVSRLYTLSLESCEFLEEYKKETGMSKSNICDMAINLLRQKEGKL